MSYRSNGFISFLRGGAWIGLLFLYALLYWSSNRVEERVETLAKEVALLKNVSPSPIASIENAVEKREAASRPWMDEAYPNLLTEDPYYIDYLPRLIKERPVSYGVRRDAVPIKPDTLHPYSLMYPMTAFIGQCQMSVANYHVGRYESFAPDAALKIEERQEGEYWVHLREGMVWQPLKKEWFPEGFALDPIFLQKHPVTAWDFYFHYNAVMNPFVEEPLAIAERHQARDIEEFTVLDDLTFVIRWKKINIEGHERAKYSAKRMTAALSPLPCFVYQYYADGTPIVQEAPSQDIYKSDSAWAQQFSRHWAKNVIVSCGPWIFDGMDASRIRFVRNPDYHNALALLIDAYEVSFKPSMEAIWQDFKAGKTDTFLLQPQQELEWEAFSESREYRKQMQQGGEIGRIDYLQRAFSYVGWNAAKPYFQSINVRKAMTLAIDRMRLIEANLHGMAVPVTGPFFVHSSAYNPHLSYLPYDPDEARRLLYEEGWSDARGDGILSKEIGGVRTPFRFTLSYYVKNKMAKLNCELIASNLKEIGIDCRLMGLDVADLTRTFEDKAFDAIYMSWILSSPPEDPRQLWFSSGAKQKGSSNAVGFANALADALIDALQYTYERQRRIDLYHKLHKIIHDEQPYTFLYIPKVSLLYREWVQNLFVPTERKDLFPQADVADPQIQLIWIRPHAEIFK